jgi:hypothetical protein
MDGCDMNELWSWPPVTGYAMKTISETKYMQSLSVDLELLDDGPFRQASWFVHSIRRCVRIIFT